MSSAVTTVNQLCNTNPLDPNCMCSGLNRSSNYKIYSPATGTYTCCGNIGLLQTSTYPTPFTSVNTQANTIYNAAVSDYPQCAGWWAGPEITPGVYTNFPNPLPSNPINIPVAGQDWYLPDTPITNGNMPPSFGPANNDIAVLMNQSTLNNLITLPVNTINGNGTTATCTVTSSAPNMTFYVMSYLNPNNAQDNYVSTLVCADPNVLKNSPSYNNSSFAVFSANCNGGVQTSGNQISCSQSIGEITEVNGNVPGNLFFASPSYKSTSNINVNPPGPALPSWAIIVIVVVVLVLVIGLAVYFGIYEKRRKEHLKAQTKNIESMPPPSPTKDVLSLPAPDIVITSTKTIPLSS